MNGSFLGKILNKFYSSVAFVLKLSSKDEAVFKVFINHLSFKLFSTFKKSYLYTASNLNSTKTMQFSLIHFCLFLDKHSFLPFFLNLLKHSKQRNYLFENNE